jgi:hypothetical protein
MNAIIGFVALIAVGWLLRRAFNRFCAQMEEDMDGY